MVLGKYFIKMSTIFCRFHMKLVDAMLSVLFMGITGYLVGELIRPVSEGGLPIEGIFVSLAAVTLALSIIFLGETLKTNNEK